MLRLADTWAWDFWLADDGMSFHLFFLRASRSLGEPHLRHERASIGHACSPDLRSWTVLPDALSASERPAFDDRATWTGSVCRGPGGRWHMFYTGISHSDRGVVQRIGRATSTDLVEWHRDPGTPIASPDARWYETAADSTMAWRDPWVFPAAGGEGWHMLITARANSGPFDERGVIGHAWSPDLRHWESRPPLSAPGSGFTHLEVPQVEVVDGRAVLLFSCLRSEFSATRRGAGGAGGVWAAAGESLLGPFDVAGSYALTDDAFYSGRLVRDRAGKWVMLAFHNEGPSGFIGEISDPIPLRRDGGGRLQAAVPLSRP